MFRVVRAVATGLVCMAIFIGCQAITDLESNPKFEDTKIIATVKAQLAREDPSTVQGIDVRVDDGVATLKGTVDSVGEEKQSRRDRRQSERCKKRGE